jgi:hypothetical protein
MQISVRFDTERLKQDLKREQQRVASASRRAVYELAHRGVANIREAMQTTFDRPTPFVLRGVYVAPRRDQNSADVAYREFGAGTTTEKVLRAQVEGGARRLKRFERLIGLPAGRIAVPGKWAELDQYGNISGGQITRILSALRMFGEQGYLANRTRRSEMARYRRALRGKASAPSEYFIVRPGAERAQLWPGIYRVAQDMGGAPLLVIAFVRAAQYRPRFAPARIVAQTVARDAAQVWDLALRRQLPFRR